MQVKGHIQALKVEMCPSYPCITLGHSKPLAG